MFQAEKSASRNRMRDADKTFPRLLVPWNPTFAQRTRKDGAPVVRVLPLDRKKLATSD
jgi:hypothetical protein